VIKIIAKNYEPKVAIILILKLHKNDKTTTQKGLKMSKKYTTIKA
jgi:adenine specific DNA methylase Mod|tara:strand:+ start:709 stop:843 length:135 start_codon:yes stop_codon:yes gene_type:complete